jgi:uncharacterized protein
MEATPALEGTGAVETTPEVGATPEAGRDPADAAARDAATDPVAVSPPDQAFRIVKVASVEVDLPEQFPVVTLEEVEEQHRRISFRIGMAEGTALAHAVDGTAAPRPLTHDLFAQVLGRFSIDILAVRLVGRRGSTYLAELDLLGPDGRKVLPCRPSDGICLALRQRGGAPVLVDDRLLSTTGNVFPLR